MLRDQADARGVLLAYLQQLRTNPTPGPLQPRLASVYPAPETILLKHLEHLEATTKPAPTAQR